jgi:cell division protein FtsQ
MVMKNINVIEVPNDIKYIYWLSNALYFLFILLLLIGSIQFYAKNEINNLHNIVIKGNVVHNDISSIRGQIISSVRGNFYDINLVKTKQDFEGMPWVNHAVVKRVYPNQIEVNLSEFKPKAIWGTREDLRLIDDAGIVFEADVDEDEYDQMPQFMGPEGQSKTVLEMYKEISLALNPLQNKIKILELNSRGSWIVSLEGGGHLELGRGNTTEVIERVKKFSQGAEQVLVKLNKKMSDIRYIDLRHPDGYAMRVQGVSTLDLKDANTLIKK